MKKFIFTLLVFFFLLAVSYPQNIPNRGFEAWETHELYEQPAHWFTGNFMNFAFKDTIMGAEKSDDAYTGNYAVLLRNTVIAGDSLAGVIVSDGVVDGDMDQGLVFSGGFPYTEKPDSLIGYFKFDVPSHDTALVAVIFRKDGAIIAENFFPIIGSQSDYTQLGFKLDSLTVTPDSALVAISSGYPGHAIPGGYVLVDDLHFNKGTQTVPNGDFEDWTMLTYDDPVGWMSGNWLSALVNSDMMCTPTTDAHSGNYALRLKTVYMNYVKDNIGIISTGILDVVNIHGGFSVNGKPTALDGYYKFLPAGSDSALIIVQASYWNTQENRRDMQITSFKLPPYPEYTYFTRALNFNDPVDTVNLVIASSYRMFEGHTQMPGSLLYLDDLYLEAPCSYTDTIDLISFTDTTICAGDSIVLDAGSGYDTYLWSDSIATQTLTVRDSGTFTVVVTDTAGCTITDSVNVNTDPCTAKVPVKNNRRDISIYPNPFDASFTIEMHRQLRGSLDISVMNILGQRVYEKTLVPGTETAHLQINMGNQPRGLYFVRIRYEGKEKIFKLVKK